MEASISREDIHIRGFKRITIRSAISRLISSGELSINKYRKVTLSEKGLSSYIDMLKMVVIDEATLDEAMTLFTPQGKSKCINDIMDAFYPNAARDLVRGRARATILRLLEQKRIKYITVINSIKYYGHTQAKEGKVVTTEILREVEQKRHLSLAQQFFNLVPGTLSATKGPKPHAY